MPESKVRFSPRDFVFLALATFALVVVALAFSLHQDHQAYTAYCQAAEHTHDEGCKLEKPFIEVLFGDPTALFTAVLAVLTFVLAVTAVGQIYFLKRTDDTARISAEAARLSAETAKQSLVASNRAWIKITKIRLTERFEVTPFGGRTSVSIRLKNIGNAPALRITPWITVGVLYKDGKHLREFAAETIDQKRFLPAGPFFLFPNDEAPNGREVSIMAVLPGYKIDRGIFERDGERIIFPLLLGTIYYQFPSDEGVYHQTRFAFQINRVGYFPFKAAGERLPPEAVWLERMQIDEAFYAD